jgi:hypothetical protein
MVYPKVFFVALVVLDKDKNKTRMKLEKMITPGKPRNEM